MNKVLGNKSIILLLAVTLMLITGTVCASATEYYFSSSSGKDSNSGISDRLPKKSFTEISFRNGDCIFLKSGDVWNECLELEGLNSITVGRYGGEENAVFDLQWNVNEAGIVFTDCEGISVSGITVKNAGAGIVSEYKKPLIFSGVDITGCDFYSVFGRTKFDPAKETARGNYRRSAGIEIIGENGASVKDIKISGCRAYAGDALLFVNVNDAENTLSKSVDGMEVSNCYVSGSLTHGIHISGVKNGRLSDSIITESRPMDYPHGITGVFLAACENFIVEGCEISYIKNFHDNPDGSGIDIEGNNTNIIVSDNSIHHCDGMAASVYYNNRDIKILSNTFYANDADAREECVMVIGDTKKPSYDIVIKDNKWYQIQGERFSFVKNLNPADSGVTAEGNQQLSEYTGVVYKEDYSYFPVGGRITGLKQKNAERLIAMIDGDGIERFLSLTAKETGAEVYKQISFLEKITLNMRVKPMYGRFMLKTGETEILIEPDVITAEGKKYSLHNKWEDVSIRLDAENKKYTICVGEIRQSGNLDSFSGTDSVRIIADSEKGKLLVDDFMVYSGITESAIEKKTDKIDDESTDFAYNGSIKEFYTGEEASEALVIRKIMKSGVTEVEKKLDLKSPSFMIGVEAAFFENCGKSIELRNGTEVLFSLVQADGQLIASFDGKDCTISHISEGKVHSIEIFYNNTEALWQVISDGQITDIKSEKIPTPDMIAFKIGEGATGCMKISGFCAMSLEDYKAVKLDDSVKSLEEANVKCIFAKNFEGGAYIEDNSVRFWNDKAKEQKDISGEVRFEVPDGLSGNIRLSFDMLLENYRTINNIILYGHDADNKERWASAMRFIFDSYGRVQYARNNLQTGVMEYAYAAALQSTSAARYEYNRFFNILYDIDIQNQTFDLYIDGVSVVRKAKLLNEVSDISLVGFKYTSEQRQGMSVKNIRFLKTDDSPSKGISELDDIIVKNNGGTVNVSKTMYGNDKCVEFIKNSSCGKVFRSYETENKDYEAFAISGDFKFDDIPREKTAIELLDDSGESILKISENNGVLSVNDKEVFNNEANDEINLMLVVYKDKYFRLMMGTKQLTEGELTCLPEYLRSGIDYNSFGRFSVKNPTAVYYYDNCVRLINNYSNNINSDTLYSYGNIHFIGSGRGNNVNVELVR